MYLPEIREKFINDVEFSKVFSSASSYEESMPNISLIFIKTMLI